jgi:hypothetical protein
MSNERNITIWDYRRRVSGQIHARAIASLPEACLVAVTDSVPAKAEQLAETYHLTAYTDIQQMLTFMIRLSAFVDEISAELNEQIAALQEVAENDRVGAS